MKEKEKEKKQKDKINDIKNINSNINNLNDLEGTYISNSPDDTILLGEKIAKLLTPTSCICLNGELGCGKTLIISSICKTLNTFQNISSPTFSIVNEYTYIKENTEKKIFHFDVYRLKDIEDYINNIGMSYFDEGICLIEWGNMIKDILPQNTIYIDFSKDMEKENKRYIHIYKEV